MGFELEPWHWWALGLIFVVVEAMFVTGTWAAMAVAAGITGAVFTAYPSLSWHYQLGIFSALTLILAYIFQILVNKIHNSDGNNGSEAKDLIGKEFELSTPLQNSYGETELDGEFWQLKGPDMKPGRLVRVVGIDGHMLAVMPVDVLSVKSDNEDELR